MSSDDLKRDLYVKVFKQELIRELQYLWDVANDRADMHDAFIDQLIYVLQQVASIAPFANSQLSYLLDASQFAANRVRDVKISFTANLMDEIDLPRLEIMADVVAREAMWRYEQFIIQRLTDDLADGVIPFAKAGVARVIEKLVRSYGKKSRNGKAELTLNESNLLSGLVEGRSGALIQGLANTTLILKREKKGFIRGLIIGNNATITAEDVYGRSGFRRYTIVNNKLQDTLYTRHKPYHQQISAWEKIQKIYNGNADIFYNFGYTYFRKTAPNDPKCTYANMPMEIIRNRYYYEEQKKDVLSKDLIHELDNWTPGRLEIDEVTFAEYLKWTVSNPKKDIRDFVKEKLGLKGVQLIQYQGSLKNFSLQGKNLSYMDLSGCTISGDLTATNFSHSYLIATHFLQVTSACETIFYAANCAFLKAEGVDFTDADFTQTNFSYAELNSATLARCKMLGTNWQQAQVKDTTGDQEVLQQLGLKIVQINLDLQLQRDEIRQNTEALQRQKQTLQQSNLEPQLADDIAYLIQKTESQQALEYYFRKEIANIKISLLQGVQKSEIDALNIKVKDVYDLLQKQQSQQKVFVDQAALAKLSTALTRQWTTAFENNQRQQQSSLQQISQLYFDFRQEVERRFSLLEARVQELEQWKAAINDILAGLKNDRSAITQNSIKKIEMLMDVSTRNPALINVQSVRNNFKELQDSLEHKRGNVALFKSQPQQDIAKLVASMPEDNIPFDQKAAEELNNQGQILELEKNYEAARSTYLEGAEKGSARARTSFGFLLMKALGGPRDVLLAYDCWVMSAMEGHVRAMINLSILLQNGDGPIKPDKEMSEFWSAEAKKSEAQPSPPAVMRKV
jgi:uncharacterized protein YjbI with pentapeptide repeats